MILFEIVNETEDHPEYQKLEVSNVNRQYDFLQSAVSAAIALDRAFLSQHVLKALNFHAITCLHTNAGEYRPCQVTVGDHMPPQHFRVQALMDDFVNTVNRLWDRNEALVLAAFVLWRLNWIHPFINGNGRTARAACYFVLCLKLEGPIPGKVILPELISEHRAEYVEALRHADSSYRTTGLDLRPLQALLQRLLQLQIESAEIPPDEPAMAEGPSEDALPGGQA